MFCRPRSLASCLVLHAPESSFRHLVPTFRRASSIFQPCDLHLRVQPHTTAPMLSMAKPITHLHVHISPSFLFQCGHSSLADINELTIRSLPPSAADVFDHTLLSLLHRLTLSHPSARWAIRQLPLAVVRDISTHRTPSAIIAPSINSRPLSILIIAHGGRQDPANHQANH